MIKIVITDDHKMFSEGIKAMLEDQKDIYIIKTLENGEQLLDFLKSNIVDVILLDINMQKLSGVDAAKIILKNYPDTKIIIVSMYKRSSIIREVIELGVHSYILKDTGKVELLKAIRKVMAGEKYFDSSVKDKFFDIYSNSEDINNIKLTPREKEILKLICDSHTTNQISEILNISSNTVESHRKNLLSKTGAKNSIGLVKFAYENQIL